MLHIICTPMAKHSRGYPSKTHHSSGHLVVWPLLAWWLIRRANKVVELLWKAFVQEHVFLQSYL